MAFVLYSVLGIFVVTVLVRPVHFGLFALLWSRFLARGLLRLCLCLYLGGNILLGCSWPFQNLLINCLGGVFLCGLLLWTFLGLWFRSGFGFRSRFRLSFRGWACWCIRQIRIIDIRQRHVYNLPVFEQTGWLSLPRHREISTLNWCILIPCPHNSGIKLQRHDTMNSNSLFAAPVYTQKLVTQAVRILWSSCHLTRAAVKGAKLKLPLRRNLGFKGFTKDGVGSTRTSPQKNVKNRSCLGNSASITT